MTGTLQQEIDRWEAELSRIAESSASDDWFVEERRLAEARCTLTAYRGRILPTFTNQPNDAIVADEITHLLDRLEDLRNDLFRTVHPPTSHQEIAETLAALRALTRVALRFDRTLENAH
ncbi:hypothetical protein AB0L70_29650 [Kribbella sp. NPDC051952]|uniref:hypothetical protein n=1 Tax=Kribbella sp. NPDC051952 TaxID=3154851 RepID=UPI003432C22E